MSDFVVVHDEGYLSSYEPNLWRVEEHQQPHIGIESVLATQRLV